MIQCLRVDQPIIEVADIPFKVVIEIALARVRIDGDLRNKPPQLSEALRLFEGPKKAWTRRDIRRAMTLIGGLDEKTAQEILDQDGV